MTDLFDSLEPEQEREVRKYKPDTKLVDIANGFLDFYKDTKKDSIKFASIMDNFQFEDLQEEIHKKVSTNIYARDITPIWILLKQFEEFHNFSLFAGIYLNSIMNKCVESELSIELDVPLDCIGALNTKKTCIHGSVGNYAGIGMKSGELIIHGNASHSAGRIITGGTLRVLGNVDDMLGAWMSEGEIIVEGNTGIDCGEYMSGGKITIHGSVASIGDNMIGGNIYHKGKLIFKDGKKL